MNGQSPAFQFSLRWLLVFVSLAAIAAGLASNHGFAKAFAFCCVCSAVRLAFIQTRSWPTWFLKICAAIFLLGIGYFSAFLDQIQGARSQSTSSICAGNQRQLARALIAYHNQHGALPPAYLCNEKGEPLHSWRTMILSGIDRPDLFGLVNLELPWNDLANQRARRCTLEVFLCPKHRHSGATNITSYLAIVGPGFAFQGTNPVSFKEFTDELSETILFVESVKTSVPWMEPRDLPWNKLRTKKQPFLGEGPHLNRVTVAFADGKTRRLPQTISVEHLRSLLTIAGDEDMSWLREPEETW